VLSVSSTDIVKSPHRLSIACGSEIGSPQRFRYRSQRPAGPRHPPPEVAGSRQSRTAWTFRRLWPIWVGAPELTFGQNFRPERPCPSQRASPRITTPPASTIQRATVHAEPAFGSVTVALDIRLPERPERDQNVRPRSPLLGSSGSRLQGGPNGLCSKCGRLRFGSRPNHLSKSSPAS
jgi:hypothetical protein